MKIWNSTTAYSVNEIVQYANVLYQSLTHNNTGHNPSETGSQYWVIYEDPLTMVYNALWDMLEASSALTSLVPVRNRIKFTGANIEPSKELLNTEDYPQLSIVPVSTTPHLQRTSTESTLLKRYRIVVLTGDKRIDAGLFAIEWEVYRALQGWVETLMSLQWNGNNFVVLARPMTVNDYITNASIDKNISGWIGIWECEVEMAFSTSDLIC